MKVCTYCGKEKSLTDFHKAGLGRRESRCKICANKLKKKWRCKNRDAIHSRNMAYRQRDPEKYAAHKAVEVALRLGKMERLPCQICGASNSEAHHVSYHKSMWLSVTWLCRQHHMDTHRLWL